VQWSVLKNRTGSSGVGVLLDFDPDRLTMTPHQAEPVVL
jgi:hypothetical protein